MHLFFLFYLFIIGASCIRSDPSQDVATVDEEIISTSGLLTDKEFDMRPRCPAPVSFTICKVSEISDKGKNDGLCLLPYYYNDQASWTQRALGLAIDGNTTLMTDVCPSISKFIPETSNPNRVNQIIKQYSKNPDTGEDIRWCSRSTGAYLANIAGPDHWGKCSSCQIHVSDDNFCCDGQLVYNYQDFSSGNIWLENHYNEENRCWRVLAPPGKVIEVRFDWVDLSSSLKMLDDCKSQIQCNDKLVLYDGPDASSPFLSKNPICGFSNEKNYQDVYITSNNSLYMRFQSDAGSTTAKSGFSLKFKFIDPPDDTVLRKDPDQLDACVNSTGGNEIYLRASSIAEVHYAIGNVSALLKSGKEVSKLQINLPKGRIFDFSSANPIELPVNFPETTLQGGALFLYDLPPTQDLFPSQLDTSQCPYAYDDRLEQFTTFLGDPNKLNTPVLSLLSRSTVILKNIIIKNCGPSNIAASPGAIKVFQANFSAFDSIFENNDDGVIANYGYVHIIQRICAYRNYRFIRSAPLTSIGKVIDSIFDFHHANPFDSVGDGGILRLGKGTTVKEIRNVIFSNTASAYQGSGILVSQGSKVDLIEGCTFHNLSSGVQGGAISVPLQGYIGSIRNCIFTNNTSKYDGGAIYLRGAINEIINSTFIGNSVSGTTAESQPTKYIGGGAIWMQEIDTKVSLSQCTFINNIAKVQGLGGSIGLALRTTLNIKQSSFSTNTAYKGGAIAALGGSSIYIDESSFELNKALATCRHVDPITKQPIEINNDNSCADGEGVGGAMYSEGIIDLSDSSFLNNSLPNVKTDLPIADGVISRPSYAGWHIFSFGQFRSSNTKFNPVEKRLDKNMREYTINPVGPLPEIVASCSASRTNSPIQPCGPGALCRQGYYSTSCICAEGTVGDDPTRAGCGSIAFPVRPSYGLADINAMAKTLQITVYWSDWEEGYDGNPSGGFLIYMQRKSSASDSGPIEQDPPPRIIGMANSIDRSYVFTTDFEFGYAFEVRLAARFLSPLNASQYFDSSLSDPIHVLICSEGQYEGDSEVQGCVACPLGTYQSKIGQRACDACPYPYSNGIGSASVADCLAPPGYFKVSDASYERCPEQSDGCSSPGTTVQSIQIKPGSWRQTPNSLNIVSCPIKEFCLGGAVDAQCPMYHHGVYCLQCTKGSAKRHGKKSFCSYCDETAIEQDTERVKVIIGALVVLFFALMAIYITYRLSPLFCNLEQNSPSEPDDGDNSSLGSIPDHRTLELNSQFDINRPRRVSSSRFSTQSSRMHLLRRTSLAFATQGSHALTQSYSSIQIFRSKYSVRVQAFISFFQILIIYCRYFNLPDKIIKIGLGSVEVAFLDVSSIISIGCARPGNEIDAIDRLYVSTITPVLLVLLISLVNGSVLLALNFSRCTKKQNTAHLIAETVNTDSETNRNELVQTIKRKIISETKFISLYIIWFLYPNINAVIFDMFICEGPFDDGTYWLRSDLKISCDSSEYIRARRYAIACICLFTAGVPILFLIACVIKREPQQRERSSIRFLWRPFKMEYYWFEIVELFRKLLQASLIPFYSMSPLLYCIPILVTVITMSSYFELMPYKNRIDAIYSEVTQFGILVFILIALMFNYRKSQADNWEVYEALFLLNIILVSLCLLIVDPLFRNSIRGTLSRLMKSIRPAKNKEAPNNSSPIQQRPSKTSHSSSSISTGATFITQIFKKNRKEISLQSASSLESTQEGSIQLTPINADIKSPQAFDKQNMMKFASSESSTTESPIKGFQLYVLHEERSSDQLLYDSPKHREEAANKNSILSGNAMNQNSHSNEVTRGSGLKRKMLVDQYNENANMSNEINENDNEHGSRNYDFHTQSKKLDNLQSSESSKDVISEKNMDMDNVISEHSSFIRLASGDYTQLEMKDYDESIDHEIENEIKSGRNESVRAVEDEQELQQEKDIENIHEAKDIDTRRGYLGTLSQV